MLSVKMRYGFEGEKDGKGAWIQRSINVSRSNDIVKLKQLPMRNMEFLEPQGKEGKIIDAERLNK